MAPLQPNRLANHHKLLSILLLHLVSSAIGTGTYRMVSLATMHSIRSSVRTKKYISPCFCSASFANQVRSRSFTARDKGTIATATANYNDNGESTSSPSFYQRLNSPTHILAPMVAQSDLPFRLMCEQLYNVDLSYTQMIHATNFVEQNGETFQRNHLDVYPQSTIRDVLLGKQDRRILLLTQPQEYALKGMSDDDIEQARKRILSLISENNGADNSNCRHNIEVKPCTVQIAAHNPDTALEAAMMILERSGSMDALSSGATSPVTAIDLNLGCPQSIARKGCYGSFLHDESPELTYKVLSKLRSELPKEIGVTAKIRLPPTQEHAAAGKLGNMNRLESGPQTIDERMRCLIDCGVDLITVHGRTRFENKVTVQAANWDAIREAVESARSYSGNEQYPIFSNGGIEFGTDIKSCLDETNASGVMSSESLLELPGLFSEGELSVPATAHDLLEQQLGYAETYLDYATIFPPLPGSLGTKGGSFNVIRSHLFKYLHRYLEENPDLRSWLGNQELNSIKQAKELISDIRSRYARMNEEQLRSKKSWDIESSWYRRHRQNIVQKAGESTPELSIEERKALAKLRIQKMKEERIKRAVNSV